MRVVIAGGTGWLGSALSRSLLADGHEVVLLSRTTGAAAPLPLRLVYWDGKTLGPWTEAIDGADAVVNLAGAPIVPKRWTSARKQLLRRSRIDATRVLVDALGQVRRPPPVLVNTSAVGYYGAHGDTPLTEEDPPGEDFLATLVVAWEAAARPATEFGVRVVLPRVGVVLGRGGGALGPLVFPFRLFLGGPLGSGRQWVSWVHLDDVVGLYRFALETEAVTGPLNVTAPNPVTNLELARTIGRALRRPTLVAVPGWALRLLLGEVATMLLDGQRALPVAPQRLGYTFREPELAPALVRTLHGQPAP